MANYDSRSSLAAEEIVVNEQLAGDCHLILVRKGDRLNCDDVALVEVVGSERQVLGHGQRHDGQSHCTEYRDDFSD